MSAKYFLRDQRGAVMVEVTIMLSITLILVFGAIDFLLLFYQWNAAAKAVQIGARLAWSRTQCHRALTGSVKRL
jgi:Flp pilus assembly protein TadG